jgi:integrase
MPASATLHSRAKGWPLRRSNFQLSTRWNEAVEPIGLLGQHFHDLRHTGNTLAEQTGAGLADLMERAWDTTVPAPR